MVGADAGAKNRCWGLSEPDPQVAAGRDTGGGWARGPSPDRNTAGRGSLARAGLYLSTGGGWAGGGNQERGEVGDHQQEDEQGNDAGFDGDVRAEPDGAGYESDRKSTRLNSSHLGI